MKRVGFIFLMIALLSSTLSYRPAPVQAEPAAPTDTPTTVVASGVTSYTLNAPKLFWYTNQVPNCPPADPAPGLDPLVDPTGPEMISRVATYGSTVRELYRVTNNCGVTRIRSNLASDANYVYWLAASGTGLGLMRLSVNANAGDAPELMNGLIHGEGIGSSFVAVTASRIYVIYTDGLGDRLGSVDKSTNVLTPFSDFGPHFSDLQVDNQYAYYRSGTSLKRVDPAVGTPTTIETGVTGYFPEALRSYNCLPFDPSSTTTNDPNVSCVRIHRVYVAKGQNIYIYNNRDNTPGASPIYTSTDTSANIYDVVTDSTRLFFAEKIYSQCGSLFCYYTKLMRATRDGASPAVLYTYSNPLGTQLDNLAADDTFIYWADSGQIKRLLGTATPLPQVDMRILGLGTGMEMEVTQGIQSSVTNIVPLIKNRPTFVRLYVAADSAVSGVTAHLYNTADPNSPLLPVNPAGTTITVNILPSRSDINQSFLFELPLSWTTNNSTLTSHTLNLHAVLNPYKMPLEPDYSDNVMDTTVYFQNSPSLSVEFFRLNYPFGGVTYSPRIAEDLLRTYSWILRAYPLAGGVGENFKPRIWDVDGGPLLTSYVMGTHPKCVQAYSDPTLRNLCASHFANGWLYYYRVATQFGWLNVGLNSNAFYYGMISDAAGFFPRGQAMYSKTSVGPTGTPATGSWDTDGTYGDWYAAHEIGHSLGRAHPNAGSDNPATPPPTFENCGHSRSDPGYPYGNLTTPYTPIGSTDKYGFDRGDAGLGIGMNVRPSGIWNDVMSYCDNLWISDYTYTGMYNYMLAHPSDVAPADVTGGGGFTGDFLIVAGSIDPAALSGDFSFIRRVTRVTDLPGSISSGYSLRLLNASDGVLATQGIQVTPEEKTGWLNFGHVMNFAAGTRKAQVILNSDGHVLATQLVSANVPVVSNVALAAGTPNPVTGIVTLNWNASDADRDPLAYDVAYSRDGGLTFQPVAINITQTSTLIDTADLGGSGTAVLRVTASDGVNSGHADSAPFIMANKPPQPFILNPENNLHVQYGQLVNFNGMALDAQDGSVASSGLSWYNNGHWIGGGPQFSVTDLPVGTNLVWLYATNSVGKFASTSVTVIVGDDLDLPGNILTAGPSQVGWQVNAGSTQLQTANIFIGNAGSGSLAFTASESASWLTLSATSGTVNAGGNVFTLILTANPTGLSAKKSYSTNLVITKPSGGGVPAQTITIPVTLAVGSLHDVYIPPNPVYLPLLRR